MSDIASYLYTPQACSITPYRPRGDFPGWLEARRAQYYPLIQAVACEAGVPVGLFDALVAQESRYDPLIVSPKGAVGLTGSVANMGHGRAASPSWGI
ncbi:transglycosylase SLT domain-containing protein, partial [Blastomonas sp. CCH1-A6]|uniref:transglycosylase SLT domain-containing protein n=1 Tax=Blastomonas sp. CCH1-A6 TaxID=1768762 RepID=UPI001923EE4F